MSGMIVADLEAVLKLNDKEYLKSMNISEKEAKKMISEIQKAHEKAEKENIKLAKESEKTRIKSAKESAQIFIQEEKRKEKEALRVEKEQQRLAKESAKVKEKEYKETQQKIEKINKQNIADQQAMYDKITSIAKTAFTALAVASSTAMIGLGKNSIEYTSDLKELENVLSVTFGDRMNAIALNADAMGRAMGRSSLQMRGMVSQAGALGKGLGFVGDDLEQMSLKLAQTAVDLGSFFNVADDEAFTALRAGLTGETEPMKRFGIVMTENNLKAYALAKGIKVLWKDMTEAEKTQVRYNYMLEKTSFFAGDAERTIGSTANQMKVLKARLGDLYQQVGGQLEPAWNDFLGTLVDSIEEIVATEEATKGLATTLETILDGANIAISGIKNLIVWYQKFSGAIGNPFEKTMIDKQFEEIKKSNSDFLKDKEDLFNKEQDIEKRRLIAKKSWDLNYHKAVKLSKEQVKGLHQELIDLEKEKYENRQSIIEAYETYEIEAYDRMVTNTKTAFEEMINASGKAKNEIGQNLIDALGFYVNFTKGMTKEIQKQVAVIGAQGAARSYIEIELKKFSDKGLKPTEKQVSDIYSKAGNLASTQYTANMKMNELKTGDQQSIMNEIASKMGYTPFEFGKNADWVSGIKGNGKDEDKKLTLEKLQSNYQAELKAFEEYAKQRQLTEEEKNQQLLQINDSYAKQAIDNGWLEYANKLSANANSLENAIEFAEETKQYNELRLENEKKYKQAELDLTEETNKEALELLGIFADESSEIIKKRAEDEKNKIQNLANAFSETSKITKELATLFEDDLLGAMSSLIGAGGNFAESLMKKDVLGSISSGLALINQLDSFLNDSDIGEKEEEANTKFQEAVESFKKSVENFSLGQKISFAKLEKPSNLVGAITGTGEKGTQLWEHMLTGGGASILDLLKGDLKASNASLDTTALQQQLASAGYGGIDVNAIFGKYAQRDSYRNWYGKKESYISGYDTAGAMAEINKLIEEAWQANLEGFAQALSLTSQDFISNMVDVFKSGGSISESVNDMFYNAVIEAFFNQELFETLNKNLSGAISEIIIGELSTEGIDLGMDFKGMSPGEMIEAYTKIYGASSDKLKEILEQLGLAASSATDQLNQVSTKNLPSGLKVASAEFQASNASYGQTYQTIYQIENNYSKDFSEMVATAQNQSRFNQTGNARRGY